MPITQGRSPLTPKAWNSTGKSESRAELWRAWTHQHLYAGSQDELTRPRDDLPSLIPAAWLAGRVLVNPQVASRMVANTVDNYALSEAAARAIRLLPLS